MAWDPQQYALFGSHRGRPFVDLLGRVGGAPTRTWSSTWAAATVR